MRRQNIAYNGILDYPALCYPTFRRDTGIETNFNHELSR